METLIHEIGLFIWLVLTGWEQYAEAGATGLVIYLIEKSLGSLSWKTLRWVAVAFLVFAFFNVWRDQYHASNTADSTSVALQKQINSLTKPNISGEFTTEAAAPTGEKKEDSLVTLGMHIRNTGAPSALENFLLVITRDGTTLQTETLPPTNITLFGGGSLAGPRVDFRLEDNLFQRAAHELIPMNGAIDVWFQALILGMTNDKVFDKGTTVYLYFDDVATGKKSSITYLATGVRMSPPDMRKLMQETH